MRILTTIPVPKSAQDAFLAASRGKLPIPHINADNLHVTLNFLGELDTDQMAKALTEWETSIPEFKPFMVEPDMLDKFGNLLVLRLKPNPVLMAMQASLQKHFSSMGYDNPL